MKAGWKLDLLKALLLCGGDGTARRGGKYLLSGVGVQPRKKGALESEHG